MNNVQKRILRDAERRVEHAGQSYRAAKARHEGEHPPHVLARLLEHYEQMLETARADYVVLKEAFSKEK